MTDAAAAIDRELFGYRLRHAREAFKLTMDSVARATGCSKAQIARAEKGQPIDAGATISLALALEIDLIDMFTGAQRARLEKIFKYQKQSSEVSRCPTVPPLVSRETTAGDGRGGRKDDADAVHS